MTTRNTNSKANATSGTILPSSNLKPSLSSSFSSWGAAFTSAAAVQPQDLGDFNSDADVGNKTTDDTVGTGNIGYTNNANKNNAPKPKYGDSGNVLGISAIAQQIMKHDEMKESKVDAAVTPSTDKSKDKRKDKSKKRKKEDAMDASDNEQEQRLKKAKKKEKKKKKESKKESKKEKKKHKEQKTRKESNDADEQSGEGEGEGDDGDDDDDINTNESTAASPTLEGQMVMHRGESLFVLLDKAKGIVYSMERSDTGDLVPIGKVSSGGDIDAIQYMKEVTKNASDNETDFPYSVDADDHCESPLKSYKHIQPILNHLAPSNQAKASFSIYDPYYCNGLVKENLQALGFPNVYNEKEDAYVTWDANDDSQPYPDYKVFITNPPYSGDHPERLIRHLTQDERSRGKPWCLLMPQYMHKKDYYKDALSKKSKGKGNSKEKEKDNGIQPFYLVPKKRYVYLPPKDFREKKESDVHKKSSPFVSMWYIWGGSREKTDELIRAYEKNGDGGCELARSTSALRDLRRKGKK